MATWVTVRCDVAYTVVFYRITFLRFYRGEFSPTSGALSLVVTRDLRNENRMYVFDNPTLQREFIDIAATLENT